jgi:hypothetical protein
VERLVGLSLIDRQPVFTGPIEAAKVQGDAGKPFIQIEEQLQAFMAHMTQSVQRLQKRYRSADSKAALHQLPDSPLYQGLLRQSNTELGVQRIQECL